MMSVGRVEDIETLQHQASVLSARAAALTRTYRRTTWVRFVLVFFPVPFTVLLLRFHLEGWHYIVAGGAYMVFSATLYAIDSAAARKCDAAVHAAESAEKACKDAASA